MTSNNLDDIKKRFKNLDTFEDYEDKIDHEKMMSMFSFLSDVQKVIDKKGWSRKKLAQKTGVTPSYLSQLYSGDKVINLEMITKITRAIDCDFEIKLVTPEITCDESKIKKVGEPKTQFQKE